MANPCGTGMGHEKGCGYVFILRDGSKLSTHKESKKEEKKEEKK